MQRGDADVGDGGVGILEERVTLVGHGVDLLVRVGVRVWSEWVGDRGPGGEGGLTGAHGAVTGVVGGCRGGGISARYV